MMVIELSIRNRTIRNRRLIHIRRRVDLIQQLTNIVGDRRIGRLVQSWSCVDSIRQCAIGRASPVDLEILAKELEAISLLIQLEALFLLSMV